MNKNVISKCLGFMVIVALWTPVQAATDLSLFAGWVNTGSIDASGFPEVDFENFGMVGVRYEKSFLFFGLENNLTYYPETVVASTEPEGDGGVSYSGNLVINFPIVGVTPFFTVGLGLLHKFGASAPDFGTSFQTNYGMGIKIRNLAGPLGVRGDFRRFTLHDVFNGENLKTNELSGGVVISF
ncbi:MAG: hypothetical protein ACRD1R_13805 [Acidobacteriota bacterium]